MSTEEGNSITKGLSAAFLLEVINQCVLLPPWMSVLSDLASCLHIEAKQIHFLFGWMRRLYSIHVLKCNSLHFMLSRTKSCLICWKWLKLFFILDFYRFLYSKLWKTEFSLVCLNMWKIVYIQYSDNFGISL